ncbi:hypothetical protein BpHYR1_034610 [Brachionus plicatilis]|uniref:Uncharacterized protein n=1 Tax=Brachionus plicatilis TaxID=10195 RepID=A0A3M7SZM4_BRAPC|nr:hypothetical protein BpHYR1_034610 [Brachionus plicatilis]
MQEVFYAKIFLSKQSGHARFFSTTEKSLLVINTKLIDFLKIDAYIQKIYRLIIENYMIFFSESLFGYLNVDFKFVLKILKFDLEIKSVVGARPMQALKKFSMALRCLKSELTGRPTLKGALSIIAKSRISGEASNESSQVFPLAIANRWNILDHNHVIGPLAFIVQNWIRVDHVVDYICFGYFLASKLTGRVQVEAVIISQMIVACNCQRFDASIYQKVHKYTFELGLA